MYCMYEHYHIAKQTPYIAYLIASCLAFTNQYKVKQILSVLPSINFLLSHLNTKECNYQYSAWILDGKTSNEIYCKVVF